MTGEAEEVYGRGHSAPAELVCVLDMLTPTNVSGGRIALLQPARCSAPYKKPRVVRAFARAGKPTETLRRWFSRSLRM